jgi:orotate phosphoribosyltransferase-like protein
MKTQEKIMKKQTVLKSIPLVTGQVSEELGINISKEFIVRKLKVKPFLETKTGTYWDDIRLIQAKLGEYFIRASKL